MRLPRQRPASRRSTSSRHVGRDKRPVVHRRTRTSSTRAAEEAARRRRTGLTSRAAVLAIAVCAVVLTLAVPLQQYLAQRAQLSDLVAQERAERARVAALEQQQARWNDPAYVREQARERLHFVKPGETAYVIVDPTPQPQPTTASAPKVPAKVGSWYGQLWSTVTTAGNEPTAPVRGAKPKPTPPKPIPPPAHH